MVTEDYYFLSHRLFIAKAAQKEGFEVCVATHVGEYGDKIKQEGFILFPVSFSRNNKNLFRQLKYLLELIYIFWRVKPDIVHNVPLKSVIFGTIASWVARVPVTMNLLPGLGLSFFNHKITCWISRFLFQRSGVTMVVQNSDDWVEIRTIAPKAKIELIRGSGVDISCYFPNPEPLGPIQVTLVARMLWHKGVAEFVKAAEILKKQEEPVVFKLVGGIDLGNIAPIMEHQLYQWQSQGFIEWLGHQENIAKIWAESHIAVLPSYREGLPKSLLEAAASGKPLIASDAPGCREIVIHGYNGLLVPVRDAFALAEAIQKLARDPILRRSMGENSRKLVCEEFSHHTVIEKTMELYEKVSGRLFHHR